MECLWQMTAKSGFNPENSLGLYPIILSSRFVHIHLYLSPEIIQGLKMNTIQVSFCGYGTDPHELKHADSSGNGCA